MVLQPFVLSCGTLAVGGHNTMQTLTTHFSFIQEKAKTRNLHPRVRVDQAVRPLPPKTLSILVGLILKLTSMCIMIYKVRKVWTV